MSAPAGRAAAAEVAPPLVVAPPPAVTRSRGIRAGCGRAAAGGRATAGGIAGSVGSPWLSAAVGACEAAADIAAEPELRFGRMPPMTVPDDGGGARPIAPP